MPLSLGYIHLSNCVILNAFFSETACAIYVTFHMWPPQSLSRFYGEGEGQGTGGFTIPLANSNGGMGGGGGKAFAALKTSPVI